MIRNIWILGKEELQKNRIIISKKTIALTLMTLIFFGLLFLITNRFGFASDNSIYSVKTNDPFIKDALSINDKLQVSLEEQLPDVEFYKNGEEYSILKARSTKADSAAKNVLDTAKSFNFFISIDEYNRDNSRFYDLFPVWIKIFPKETILSSNESFLEEFNTSLTPTGEESSIQNEIDEFRADLSRPNMDLFKKRAESILFKANYQELTTPGNLIISLPFKSIFFGLLIITPLIFISTGYLSSLFNERINKKSSVMATAPVTTFEILAGKTLPYLLASILLSYICLAFAIREIKPLILAFPGIIVIILAYFSLSFLIALIARSYKEISFLKTTTGSVFIGYLLLPTLFLSIHNAAYISPISSITDILTKGGVQWEFYLFSILPLLATSVLVFYVSARLYNEEAFNKERISDKLSFVVSSLTNKAFNIAIFSFFSFPVVVLLESVFLIFLSLPFDNLFLPLSALIIVAAIFEEFFKNYPIFTAYRANKKKSSPFTLGILSGSGFALAEKGILLIMIPELITKYYMITIPSLIAPFIFHSLTCIAFAFIIKNTRISFTKALVVPLTMHIMYNIAIVALTGAI